MLQKELKMPVKRNSLVQRSLRYKLFECCQNAEAEYHQWWSQRRFEHWKQDDSQSVANDTAPSSDGNVVEDKPSAPKDAKTQPVVASPDDEASNTGGEASTKSKESAPPEAMEEEDEKLQALETKDLAAKPIFWQKTALTSLAEQVA